MHGHAGCGKASGSALGQRVQGSQLRVDVFTTPFGQIRKLIVADLAHREVLRGRVSEEKAADAGRWVSWRSFPSSHADGRGVQYAEQVPLFFAVIRQAG